MTTQKSPASMPRKLSTRQAKRVAQRLQRASVGASGSSKVMKPLSLKSTATGKGSVVFRASRVLGSLAGAAKS